MKKLDNDECLEDVKQSLIDDGYDAIDVNNAYNVCKTYNMSLSAYANEYLTKSKESKTVKAIIKEKRTTPVISKPGTEIIDLSTSVMDLMRCKSITGAPVYCMVVKDSELYSNKTCTNSSGEPVVVLQKITYDIINKLIYSATSKIQTLENELRIATNEKDLYKSVIDCLRDNGIIK